VIRQRSFPLVIAAPSGVGKTSLARALVERSSNAVFALSATTRPPRPGERHDEDYHFVDEAGFDALIAEGLLLEWASVHGRKYGTLRRGVQAGLDAGRTVVLDIDVQGARMVRGVLPDAVLVFILPPTVAEMMRRLKLRGSGESAEELAIRVRTARGELEVVEEFDYVVVNDDFERALHVIEAVVAAERARVDRAADLARVLEAMRHEMDETMRRSD
jgi:guanylate kinase